MQQNLKYRQAVKSFMKYLIAERGYSKLTIKEYKSDLNLFARYLEDEFDCNVDRLTIDEINQFQLAEFLSDIILINDNSAATRNRKLYSLRSFFNFLVKRNLLPHNPTLAIDATKVNLKSEPVYLKGTDINDYLKAIENYNSKARSRDLAINKMFLYCGLRISELVNLDLDDINYEDNSIKFYGKGNKERYVPLHEEVILAVKNYLPDRAQIEANNDDATQALFLSNRGNRINIRTVQMMVKKYAKLAGVKNANDVTPHKLRHTFASMLYKETKDLRVLQELLGHSNISTTQIYTHTDKEERKRAVEQLPKL
ncbi:integrase/recombinase XerC [Orenia metallireducens]|uniref:Integrase/recombinase XerC n=1 Tax=Orenia metallireducens TaxID=1413210 RepID=A0A285F3H7_9FIRM|nr:tyrosine recombinase XerC [Orenia metallireducens]PRX34847.1 integrase/recombinase XerC [Orenia metallireducens]SNY05857.1 integrase/recombinase XerC [Orenia metallireducens]